MRKKKRLSMKNPYLTENFYKVKGGGKYCNIKRIIRRRWIAWLVKEGQEKEKKERQDNEKKMNSINGIWCKKKKGHHRNKQWPQSYQINILVILKKTNTTMFPLKQYFLEEKDQEQEQAH